MDVTNFEKIKNMNIDEFAEWLDGLNNAFDTFPWVEWWNNTYCKNCEPEIKYFPRLNKKVECAWCEFDVRCKFFPDRLMPTPVETIKLWLESEIKDEI